MNYFIDVRLFGITLPLKDPKRGSSITSTGPLQFNWGYSLNKVELIDSPSITSHFAGRTKGEGEEGEGEEGEGEEGEGEEGGAIGKDWRLYYSLIAFYGRISSKAAEYTKLTPSDINDFDNAIWQSIMLQTNTRTKLNQTSRLYIRIEYNDNQFVVGDLRRYIDIDKKEELRDIYDVILDISKLYKVIQSHTGKIAKVYYRYSEELKIKDDLFNKLVNELAAKGVSVHKL